MTTRSLYVTVQSYPRVAISLQDTVAERTRALIANLEQDRKELEEARAQIEQQISGCFERRTLLLAALGEESS